MLILCLELMIACHYNYLSHLNALPISVPCVHVKLLRDRKVQGIYHVGEKNLI